MGKPVTTGQALGLMSVLSLNTDWGQFDSDEIQKLVEAPKEIGDLFQGFLRSALSPTDDAEHMRLKRLVPLLKTVAQQVSCVRFGSLHSAKELLGTLNRNWITFKESFQDWVVPDARMINGSDHLVFSSYTLRRDAVDTAVRAALPPKFEFRDHELCRLIWECLDPLRNNCSPLHLNPKFRNLFYVGDEEESCPVSIMPDEKYIIERFPQNDMVWKAGTRVFVVKSSTKAT